MASHLKNHPDAKVVINFAPVLLEQLDDYVAQIKDWLEKGRLIRDPLLAALAGPGLPVDQVSRKTLIAACLRAKLAKQALEKDSLVYYLNDRFLVDLLVWYHLAWVGECGRINDLRIRSLQIKGYAYDADDRRRLVELIGFTYGDWHTDDAVGDLVHHLENIANACREKPDAVVSVIMDGENAWEHYPENGSYFLNALYRRLAAHPHLELTTFSAVLKNQYEPAPNLPHLVAGSWVYGRFTTWIGDRDKNRAWDMLDQAKAVYDRETEEKQFSQEQRQEIERQLAICEGSDWFWWFGDYNSAETGSEFERLFRRQLTHLCELLQEPAPEYLSKVFAVGNGDIRLGDTMRKNEWT